MKYCTLLTTAILALSPVIGFADDSGQPLFGTEPVIISEQVVNDEISPKLLEDYNFYVGKWRSDEKFLTIDATGKDTEGGQIAYDSYGNITLSYSVGGFIVMAVPAGFTYPHDASIGDTTKDRLYLIHDYPYPIVLYREADYLAMISSTATDTATTEVLEAAETATTELVAPVTTTETSVQETDEVSSIATTEAQSKTDSTPAQSTVTNQSTTAPTSARPLPKTGESASLWLSVLGVLVLTLGTAGAVLRFKK